MIEEEGTRFDELAGDGYNTWAGTYTLSRNCKMFSKYCHLLYTFYMGSRLDLWVRGFALASSSATLRVKC